MSTKQNEPGGLPTDPAPKRCVNGQDKVPDPANQAVSASDQVAIFVKCIFDNSDLVEIRRLPSRHSTWHEARELGPLVCQLQRENQAQQIYVGANPRACVGDGRTAAECDGVHCGRCAQCVTYARCVFVDCDKTTVEEVRIRLRDSQLPAPSLIVSSGGGVHAYWRLEEPLADLAQWTAIQQALATVLHSDISIHDAPRVMRLPGFQNHKYNPTRPCRIIEADPARVYSVDEFPCTAPARLTKNENAKTRPEAIVDGQRNNTLFKLAAAMRAHGCDEGAILGASQLENQRRCKPPLDDAEVRRIAKSACRYPSLDERHARAWKPFPIHVLPEPIRTFVAQSAAAIGCEPAYVALPVLAVIAAAIGTTRRILLKGTWAEAAILWCVIVGHSGTLKSPALEYALTVFRKLQANKFREYDEAVEKFQGEWEEYEFALKAWQKAKADQRGKRPEKPKAPILTRYVVSDTTIEALAPILMANPRGVLLGRDELAAWLGSFERYRAAGKGGDSAQWLEMHRAGFVLVDRKTGTPRTSRVPLAGVSITGSIQPATLQRSLGREHFENGLAARLLLVYAPRTRKRWSDADVSPEIHESFARVLNALLTLGHGQDEFGQPVAIDVPLDTEAREAWIPFYNEHADRQADTHDGDLAAAFSKLEGYAARFALMFHFVKWASDPTFRGDAIGVDSIMAGVELARWFCDETERIYGIFAKEDEFDPRLLELLRQKGTVSARDAMRGGPCFKTAEEAEAALASLARAGMATPEWRQDSKGGRPTLIYRDKPADGQPDDATPPGTSKNGGSVSVSDEKERGDGSS